MRPLLLSAALLGSIGVAAAQTTPAVDVSALVHETQFSGNEAKQVRIVWWIPVEFWTAVVAKDKTVTPDQAEMLLSALRPYLIVAVANGQMGTPGIVNYDATAVNAAALRVTDSTGFEFKQVPLDSTPENTQQILNVFHPIFTNMLGALGANISVILFRGTTPEGQQLIDPRAPGALILHFHDATYRVRLPLGSLLPLKKCPVDGEMLNGAWTYCPWHGVKLEPPTH